MIENFEIVFYSSIIVDRVNLPCKVCTHIYSSLCLLLLLKLNLEPVTTIQFIFKISRFPYNVIITFFFYEGDVL